MSERERWYANEPHTADLGGSRMSRSAADPITAMRTAALALDRYHARYGAHGALCPDAFLVSATGEITLQPPTKTPSDAVRAYWSPQRRAGESPRPSDDLYALGMIAVELLRASADSEAAGTAERRQNLEQAAAVFRTLTAWSPSERPASGGESVRALDAATALVCASQSTAAQSTPTSAPGNWAGEPAWAAARRVAQARRAHRLAQSTPPRPVRPPRPRQVRAPLGKGHYPDMPLATGWVALLVLILCSVYLAPVYFMLFPST